MNGPMALYGGDVPIFVTSQSVKPATSYYYSIKPFIAALKVTTRTELKVECGFYNSTAENNRFVDSFPMYDAVRKTLTTQQITFGGGGPFSKLEC